MRWNAWVALVIAMLAGLMLWIFLLRGPRILDNDPTLIIGQLLLGMGLITIAGLIFSTPADAIKLALAHSRWIIIGGTVLIQVLGVLLLWPALSSDLARYRLDGLTWLTGNSPYAVSSREMLKTNLADSIDHTLPSNDFHSIYPPVAQTVFIAARAVEMAVFGPAKVEMKPGMPISARWRPVLSYVPWVHRGLVLRTIFAAAAVGCVLVLLQLLEHTGRTPWLAVLFAWNPLVALETAGSGHVDIVGVLLLLVMLRMLQKQNFAMASLALCLACGVKPMLILLAPLLVRQISELRDWRVAQRSIFVVAIALSLVFGPILLVQGGYRGWIVQLNRYSNLLEVNSGLYALGKSWVGAAWMNSDSRALFQLLTPLASAGALLWILKKRLPIEDAGYWLMLCILLIAPAAYPVSIVWPLCFVPVMTRSRGWAALTWSASAALAYAAWHQSAWEVPGRILIAEYAPVVIALVIEIRDSVVQARNVLETSVVP